MRRRGPSPRAIGATATPAVRRAPGGGSGAYDSSDAPGRGSTMVGCGWRTTTPAGTSPEKKTPAFAPMKQPYIGAQQEGDRPPVTVAMRPAANPPPVGQGGRTSTPAWTCTGTEGPAPVPMGLYIATTINRGEAGRWSGARGSRDAPSGWSATGGTREADDYVRKEVAGRWDQPSHQGGEFKKR